MAEVNANSLPAKTDLGSNDSAIVVDQTTNAGALVDLDVLADKVLDRLTSKTFANQVGGSSAATLLAQLSTLNSNKMSFHITYFSNGANFEESIWSLYEYEAIKFFGISGQSLIDAGLSGGQYSFGFVNFNNSNSCTIFLFDFFGMSIVTRKRTNGTWSGFRRIAIPVA